MATRLLLSSHQGVYVKKKPGDNVNSDLNTIGGLKTTLNDSDGEIYILKNADPVAREMSLISDRKGLPRFRMAALPPLPAGNAPDDVRGQMRVNKIYPAVSALGVIALIVLMAYLIGRYLVRDLNPGGQKPSAMAMTDALTGLYNRREGRRLIDIETMRASRIQTCVCAIMVDIDHLHEINDTYGRETGDAVLAGVASALQKILRASDIVCRYGGEEFLILATETNIENVKLLAERIRSSIEKENFSVFRQLHIQVTVSIGLAQYQTNEPFEYMIFRADQALYQAKSNGRNRVCAG